MAGDCPSDTNMMPGPVGSDTPDPLAEGGLSSARRIEILDEISRFMDGLGRNQMPGQQNQAIVDFLNALPDVQSAESDPTGAIWGRFSDGRLFGVYNEWDRNPLPPVTQEDLIANGFTKEPQRGEENEKRHTAARNIPGWSAQLITGLPEGSFTSVTVLERMFTNGGWILGTDGPRPSVEDFKLLGGAGFYYFEGHGTLFKNDEGAKEFGFVTAIPVNLNNDLQFSQELLDGSVYPIASSDGAPSSYVITAQFIQNHVLFSDESVVWFNACCSASEPAQKFIDACFAKDAGIYIGWDASVQMGDAFAAAYQAVNVGLGLNATVNIGGNTFLPQPPSPKQRPFSIQSAFNSVAPKKPNGPPFTNLTGTAGMGYGESVGVSCTSDSCDEVPSKLTFLYNDSLPSERRAVGLSPSIRMLDIDEKEKRLTIYGEFDNDGFNRKVVVGGQTFLDAEWGTDKIVLNDFPEDLYGDVRVIYRSLFGDERQFSNRRWLTRISNVKISITEYECQSAGGGFYCGDPVERGCNRYETNTFSNMSFRADMGMGRDVAWREPRYQNGGQYPSYLMGSNASHTWSVGGQDRKPFNALEIWSDNSGSTSFVIPDLIFQGIDSGVGENEFSCYWGIYDADPDDLEMIIEPSAWVPDGLEIRIGSDCNGQEEYVSGVIDLGGNSVVYGDPGNTVSGNWRLPLNGGAGWSAINETYDDGDDMYEYSVSKPTIQAWPDANEPQ